jgi:hypothetical protein
MELIEDNTLIFSILEEAGQLPPTYHSNQVYSFLKQDTLHVVIYASAGNEKGFLLFRVPRYTTNLHDLNNILAWLENKMETFSGEIHEKAMQEVAALINSARAGTMFFDAH